MLRRNETKPRLDKHTLGLLVEGVCRVGYDHLIIDTPALEESPSVAQLLGAADGVLLAVRAGRTTARALRRSFDRIAQDKALGMALLDPAES